MCKKLYWLVLFLFLLFIPNACSNSTLQTSPTIPSPEESIPDAHPAAADGTKTQQPTATPAVVHTITPAASGALEKTQEDTNSSSTATRKLALGDSFRLGIFERPFTAGDMNYVADTDLLEVSLSSDENFLYVVINLEENRTEDDHRDAYYGVEFDTDLDGRGDILLWAQANGASDWTTDGVSIFEDANQDVGGSRPVYSDSSQGDGYESVLFSPQQAGDPDSAWQRADGAQFHLAIKQGLIGTSGFFWKVWADNGLADPSLFDYNDSLSEAQAGSPSKGCSSFYPVDTLSQVDSTCWIAYNYRATGYEPGGCYRPPVAASAKKSGSHGSACPPCGTYEMSFDCCVACGSSYLWTGTGCRASGKK